MVGSPTIRFELSRLLSAWTEVVLQADASDRRAVHSCGFSPEILLLFEGHWSIYHIQTLSIDP